MIENPYPDPSVPTPGILIKGTQRRSKQLSIAGRRVLASATALVGVAGLAYEALNGWPTSVRLWVVLTIPMAVVWAAVIAVGISFLGRSRWAPWYQAWSFVEYFDEPHGMRLVAGRLGPDQPGLIVRRGDVVEVHAVLTTSARAGLERHYAFRIVAPSGVMELDAQVWIEHLTMAPLEQRAATWGIEIAAYGEATQIQRLDPHAVIRPTGS